VKVTSREKTLIIIALIVLIAVGIFYTATLLVPDSESLSKNVDLKKRMLRSRRETLTRQDSYWQRLEQAKKQLDQDKTRFLTGNNATLAGADLQKVLRNYADQISLELNTSNILTEKRIPDIATKVSVQINAPAPNSTCTPDQLVQFLTLIENHEKLLIIDDMNVSSRYGPSIRGVSRKYEIQFSLTVSGFITPQDEKPKAKAESRSGMANVS
jgi:hypothetical protein